MILHAHFLASISSMSVNLLQDTEVIRGMIARQFRRLPPRQPVKYRSQNGHYGRAHQLSETALTSHRTHRDYHLQPIQKSQGFSKYCANQIRYHAGATRRLRGAEWLRPWQGHPIDGLACPSCLQIRRSQFVSFARAFLKLQCFFSTHQEPIANSRLLGTNAAVNRH
jgi:hypothetical protein